MRIPRHSGARRAMVACVVAISAAALPSGARAQLGGDASGGGDQHLLRIGLSGGVSVPMADARDAFKNGVNSQGFLQVQLPGGFPALRFALSYDRFEYKPTVANGLQASDAGNSQMVGGMAGLKIHLLPGPVRPYIMAGLGAFNVNDVLNLESGQTSTSKINFGVDGGAGLEVKLGRLAAFAEGRIQNVYTRSTGVISRSAIQSVPVSFGLMF